MKLTTILIVALIAASAFAVDENCKDHPWDKKDIFKKFKAALEADATDLTDQQKAEFTLINDAFNKD